jgi:hypothetical protein
MRQRKTRSIPKTGVKTFENEKLSAFLHSLPEGDMLYSPLLGYMTVYDINESGVVMALPNPAENEPYDWPFLYDGRISHFPQGECMLFLSHLYRSWNVLKFQLGDIVAMDLKYKDGNILTYIVIFSEVESTDYPKIRTYACLCKNSDVLTSYALLDLRGTREEEEESIELRYATSTEEKLLNNAVEKIGKRWDKVKLRLVSLDSEAQTPEQLREDFNALQEKYSRLCKHCKKLENERNYFQKKAELESGRTQEILYKAIE